jgi:GT2 family glycosyltransferase
MGEPCRDLLVSVIIPVYRRTAWIGPCLQALAGQECSFPFEVVIVDDGSPNAAEIAAAVAAALEGTGLDASFLRKKNGGPAAARNFAVAKARGSLFCFIDDDSVAEPGWLEQIAAPFLADPGLGVVSGRIRSFQRDEELPRLLERAVYTGVHWATCNIAYRAEVFAALGGFDERFREAAWEDNDLGLRARWAGHRQLHCLDAIVRHPHEESLEEYRAKCLVNGRGAWAFSRKYLIRKPLWAIMTPVIMSRHLLLLPAPAVLGQRVSPTYLKFLWSLHSLRGFLGAMTGITCE